MPGKWSFLPEKRTTIHKKRILYIVWREYIDNVYKSSPFPQPHYDPATKSFYLSDSAACSPKTGAVVYGSPGAPDVFKLY